MANGIATLEDVSNLAGVCKSTASRILAVKSGTKLPFSTKTQAKVRSAAERLGYKPSKLARSLTQTKTGIVGLVIPSVKDSFFPSVTTIIELLLAEVGYSVILCNTNGNSQVEREKVEDLLSWRADGFIVAPSQETGDAGLFWELWRNKVPFVLIDRAFPQTPFCSVTTDDHVGASLAVEHLLSIGRKRIARVGGPLDIFTNRLRHAGYTEALMRHGILPNSSYFLEVPPTEEGGAMAFSQMADMEPHPDAVFCFSDPVAIGVSEACRQHGVRIPEDLAIVGYANLHYSSLLKTPLTTVQQPRELIARRAAEQLIAEMEGSGCQPSEPLPVELIVRESTVMQPREKLVGEHNAITW